MKVYTLAVIFVFSVGMVQSLEIQEYQDRQNIKIDENKLELENNSVKGQISYRYDDLLTDVSRERDYSLEIKSKHLNNRLISLEEIHYLETSEKETNISFILGKNRIKGEEFRMNLTVNSSTGFRIKMEKPSNNSISPVISSIELEKSEKDVPKKNSSGILDKIMDFFRSLT